MNTETKKLALAVFLFAAFMAVVLMKGNLTPISPDIFVGNAAKISSSELSSGQGTISTALGIGVLLVLGYFSFRKRD